MDSLRKEVESLFAQIHPYMTRKMSKPTRRLKRGPTVVFGTLMSFAHHILHGGKHVQTGKRKEKEISSLLVRPPLSRKLAIVAKPSGISANTDPVPISSSSTRSVATAT
ncbi:MAG: hypothetical protein WBB23_17670 [Desulforhopalus sp.]